VSVQDASVRRDHPTEANPETGRARLRVGDQDIVLSDGMRWVEPDGEHVIRSLEFDVIAGGRTFEEALSKFIDSLFDFAAYLGELEDPAENEEEMFHRLAPRLVRLSRELERCRESQRKLPLLSVNLSRRRSKREDVREWQPLSRQRGSRLPSPA
jgi:hypothetical protein